MGTRGGVFARSFYVAAASVAPASARFFFAFRRLRVCAFAFSERNLAPGRWHRDFQTDVQIDDGGLERGA